MKDEDININDFTDRLLFTMDGRYFDWDKIEEQSDSNPTPKEYRKLMKELNLIDNDYRLFRRFL